MRLEPFVRVDDWPFTTTPAQLVARRGEPQRRERNGVGLEEYDYGDAVFRFQDGGRLEEVTMRAPVLYLGRTDLPFVALDAHVRALDADAFERGGFVVSPRFGIAFAPACPDWVTALAPHCLPTWRAL